MNMYTPRRAHAQTHTREVGETFEGFTIAHLSTKLKMVIDPWNINGQQCFSLSCEGERGEAFGQKKENRKEKEQKLYLMLILYCKKARREM